MVNFANSMLTPGKIGSVPLISTIERTRYLDYEEDFSIMVAEELHAGKLTRYEAEEAICNFHDFMISRQAQTSPNFYQ